MFNLFGNNFSQIPKEPQGSTGHPMEVPGRPVRYTRILSEKHRDMHTETHEYPGKYHNIPWETLGYTKGNTGMPQGNTSILPEKY